MYQHKRSLQIALLPLLIASYAVGQSASPRHLVRYNAWEQSANPAGIYFTPADSLLEARAGYNLVHTPLPLSDQPVKTQNYGAEVYGYQRFNRLQLTGGISWQQERREGHDWNFLVLPDYIVAAGDTAGYPQCLEQYHIYGKAAYALSPRLTAGLSAIYTATDNRGLAPEKSYDGNAHTFLLSTGLIREGEQLRAGFSVVYRHTSEIISYPSDNNDRLYSYPLGYYLPMGEIGDPDDIMGRSTHETQLRSSATSNSSVFHSTGYNWKVALQAEWHPAGWNWFNEVHVGYQHRRNNPNPTRNLLGWIEQFGSFGYEGRLTRSRGRWTHLVSPRFAAQRGVSDRILQHVSYDDIASTRITFATFRLASRQQLTAGIDYELARDYSPAGRSFAWQASALWYRQQEELYSHPFTHTQYTNQFRGEVAFLRDFRLRGTSGLTLRPAFVLATGYGVEEEATQEPGSANAVNNYRRSYGIVSQNYAARTATRLGLHLQAEYRHPLSHTLTAGLRLHAGMEQVTGNKKETGGQVVVGVLVWM